MLKRGTMAVVVSLTCFSAASAQTTPAQPAAGDVVAAAGADDERRYPEGDDDSRWRHRAVVRADRGDSAGKEMVLQRLPGELRLRGRVHGRVELAGHLRRRPRRSRRAVRRVPCGAAHRSRRAADLHEQPGIGRDGQRLSVRASGVVGEPARRPVDRREDQPGRAVAQSERRAGLRAARDGQDPDREG